MAKIAAIALICLTAWPMTAQTKALVTKSRVVSDVPLNGRRSFALPALCDENGNSYVKLVEGRMEGPLLKLSSTGKLQAEFNTEGALTNIYAVRPNGGVAMVYSDSGFKVGNFDPNGKRESEVKLDRPPIFFFPTQIAVFPSGEILVAGLQKGDKASTAIYDSRGHLVKQFPLDGDGAIEKAIEIGDVRYARAPGQGNHAVERSAATTGDDGLVYLMRATSPATVYAISAGGDVIRKIAVGAPTDSGLPDFGIRMVKNKLTVKFSRSCNSAGAFESCEGTIYAVVDATTGKRLADYEAADSDGPFACYAPDPDRFFTFSMAFSQNRLEVVEAGAK